MYRKLTYYCTILLLSGFITSQAQQEINLNLRRTVWQANRTNPAFLPDYAVVIGLPSIHNNLYLVNTNLESLVDRENNRITLGSAIDQLENNNNFREYLDVETMSGGFYLGKLHLSLHHAFKFNGYSQIPKKLAEVIYQGNAQFIGETVDLSHDLSAFSYSEFGLGLGIKLGENVSLGGRLKYLSGLGNISTSRGKFQLTTDDDIYQINLNADYQIDATNFVQYNGLSSNEGVAQLMPIEFKQLISQNQGLAFDAGIYLDFEDVDIGLSILDIGSITWDDNPRNYSIDGTYNYEGLDLLNAYFRDTISFSSVLDSLESVFNVQESQNAYTTELPTRFYASFNYYLSEDWSLGAGVYTEWYRENFFSAVTLNAQAILNDLVSVGATYTLFDQNYDHLGFNAQFHLGSVQLYAMTNNIMSAFQYRKGSNVDFRVGLNFRFSELKEEEDY
ncbi:MAG: DUF5723 family protein [Bacteroidota bacterium]